MAERGVGAMPPRLGFRSLPVIGGKRETQPRIGTHFLPGYALKNLFWGEAALRLLLASARMHPRSLREDEDESDNDRCENA